MQDKRDYARKAAKNAKDRDKKRRYGETKSRGEKEKISHGNLRTKDVTHTKTRRTQRKAKI